MILIITNRTDVTADFVVRELTRRSVPFARLNTDEFPQHAEGTVRFPGGVGQASLRWTNRKRKLHWGDVKAIWYRRPIAPVPDDAVTDPGVRKFAIDECYDFLRGLWYSLDCLWVSHPDAIRRAEHKIVQLGAAANCGLLIPETLVSNSPEDAQAFVDKFSGRIVAKALYAGFLEAEGEPRFIYATQPSPESLEHLHDVSLAPCIFQERIDKVADIRVTVVGERTFAVRIDTAGLPAGVPDWRASSVEDLSHSPYSLPVEIEARCVELTRALGLRFGAIDLAIDHEGSHVFFEINANGQWAWLETATGAKISSAIADLLTSG